MRSTHYPGVCTNPCRYLLRQIYCSCSACLTCVVHSDYVAPLPATRRQPVGHPHSVPGQETVLCDVGVNRFVIDAVRGLQHYHLAASEERKVNV